MSSSPEVTITVSGVTLDPVQQEVVSLYEQLAQTFIEKNRDYGDSYVRSAAVHTQYTHGDVTDDRLLDAIASHIWVRMLDKQSRTHQLLIDGDISQQGLVDDESIEDTLLDWANYCTMLAAQCRLYATNRSVFHQQYTDDTDDEETYTLSFEGQTLTFHQKQWTARDILMFAGVNADEYCLTSECGDGHKRWHNHELLHVNLYEDHHFSAVPRDAADGETDD